MANAYIQEKFGIDGDILKLFDDAAGELFEVFSNIDRVSLRNEAKVLWSMQKNRLATGDFAAGYGYGYNDRGREVTEAVYADVFGAEAALCRPQIISGTHAIAAALFGNLREGDELLYVTGEPYDTLCSVIGLRDSRNSLMSMGVSYACVDFTGDFTEDDVERAVYPSTKMVGIQRSRGYSLRPSLSVSRIRQIISAVKRVNPEIICMVDNCYGEFTEIEEPIEAGADIVAGSLIKNPGAGIASAGGYIAGRKDLVENAADRLTAPGLGREIGPNLGMSRQTLQGLFMAPPVVAGALKAAALTARVLEKLGKEVSPKSFEERSDIVQAVNLGSREALLAFCAGAQAAGPVDCFAKPASSLMPGYDCEIIMASAAFTQGSSIEFSADAPVREPYTAFLQGGISFEHARLGAMIAVNNLRRNGFV
ncbi:MAG: methionine gamma-lyase family protein [Clostridiales bacterium]|nr:methionine gamma-lyase family protein [Clostridiales bacterium]